MNAVDSITKFALAHLFVEKRTIKKCTEFLLQIKTACYNQILFRYYIEKYNKRDYDTWFNLASALLDRADCLLRIPGESPGAEREVEKAKELSIPIFYSFEELAEGIKINGSI